MLQAAHVKLERHPAKIQSQKVTSILFDFSTLRFFDFSSSVSPFDFSVFCFFLPL